MTIADIRSKAVELLALIDALDTTPSNWMHTLNGNNPFYDADFAGGKYYAAGAERASFAEFIASAGFTGAYTLGAHGLTFGNTPIVATSDFSTWNKANIVFTPNNAMAADGTMTASTIADNATNGFHELLKLVNITQGASYGLAIDVKAGTCTKGRLWFVNAATGFYTDFNLVAGTTSAATDFGSTTPLTSSITPLANGVYRITVAGIAGALTSGNFDILPRDNGITYAGSGKAFSVSNARMEALAAKALVSNITAPTAITRVIHAKTADCLPTDLYQVLHHLDNNVNTTNGYSDLEVYRGVNGNVFIECKKLSTTTVSGIIDLGHIPNNTAFKISYTASAAGLIASLNGGPVATSNIAAWPTDLTKNRLNGNISAGRAWGGSLARDTLFFGIATDSQLQSLSVL